MEADVSPGEFLGDLLHQTLERQLADQKFLGLLILPYLTERDGPRAIPVRLLDSASGRVRLAGRLGGELLPGAFPPVYLRAVCLVRAMVGFGKDEQRNYEGKSGPKILPETASSARTPTCHLPHWDFV